MVNSTFYMVNFTLNILFTANFRIFIDVHNALRPSSNKDGCHYPSFVAFEEAAIIMARYPARKRSEHGLFLSFDNFKLLFSTISTFGEAERYNNLRFEDVDEAADRLITVVEAYSSQILKITTI